MTSYATKQEPTSGSLPCCHSDACSDNSLTKAVIAALRCHDDQLWPLKVAVIKGGFRRKSVAHFQFLSCKDGFCRPFSVHHLVKMNGCDGSSPTVITGSLDQ